MFNLPDVYEPLLARVEKPGRYAGGEINTTPKDPATIKATIALAFPDLYEIGISYHGFRILYERINAHPDFAAERVYTPWPDYAEALRGAALPLTTLETYRQLREIEVLGFTLQHELNYTNVLEMLDLAGIPLRSAQREEAFPLVIAGGEGAYSPEPMAEFVDAFILGDGEEVVFDILELASRARATSMSRRDLLHALSKIEGVYVPSLYTVACNPDATIHSITPKKPDIPGRIRPRRFNIASDPGPVRPIVPLIRAVQDRTVVEVRRGCVNGCRFCQAGMITRPVRERPVDQVLAIVRESLENTGDEEVSLLSLSTADHSRIGPLVEKLRAQLDPGHVSISLPSLRISAFDVDLAAQVSSVRKSGFTFAPEAGGDALRRTINKPLDEEAFLNIIEKVVRQGWRTIKMYFMIGLPGETDEDLNGIVSLVSRALDRARSLKKGKIQINVTISPFAPKSHTPFQWEPQPGRAEIIRRLNYLRDHFPRRDVAVKTSPVDASILEAILARGDRRLADVIEQAWRQGCRFDGWREHFQPEKWWAAFAACNIDPAWYSERQRGDDEIFPYDHIDSPPGKPFLIRQRDLSRSRSVTQDCAGNPCSGCAACEVPPEHVLASDAQEQEAAPSSAPSLRTKKRDACPAMRVRLRFTKTGALRFISHLDLAQVIRRLLRRAGVPLLYSQGFNPHPQMSLSPPLPLGFEGAGEILDLVLTERVDLKNLLRDLGAMAVDGLNWTAAEETHLKAESLQQQITQFRYRLAWHSWGAITPTLPLDNAALQNALQPFLDSASWPLTIMRKGKMQERDARSFVAECHAIEPHREYDAAMEITILSKDGTSLNPLAILESIFGDDPAKGVVLHVARMPLDVQRFQAMWSRRV